MRILHAVQGQDQWALHLIQRTEQIIFAPRSQRQHLGRDPLMSHIPQRLLQSLRIHPLYLGAVLARQSLNRAYPWIITALGQLQRQHPIRMAFQQRLHGVQPIDQLTVTHLRHFVDLSGRRGAPGCLSHP
ncbi:MAG: hypothetical protein WDM77_07170 [Steroidobacteraceae bacterium]